MTKINLKQTQDRIEEELNAVLDEIQGATNVLLLAGQIVAKRIQSLSDVNPEEAQTAKKADK